MRTPSQTVGPFFSFGLCAQPQNELPGGSVRVEGQVFDGGGAPIPDAMIEIWDPHHGFGRCGTDVDGRFGFRVPAGASRFDVMLFARGLLKPALTRLYLSGEDAEDPTMLAHAEHGGFRFDVHLQGDRATAFFEL